MLILIAAFFLTTAALGQDTNLTDGIRVTTEQGTVVGFKATDGDYLTFYSIRYAGDVSGANRFKAAPPPPKIDGEFRAFDRNIVCAQPAPHGVVGVEDCLTLNIFTRNVTGTRPVFVWINGEEYSRTNDTPRYSFKSLVEADMIFIALNYRLSIFGFLCLGVEEAPGNAGLKDVIQALQWVNANVAAFGGDPKNVILLGHGSGAAMVDLITMSPQSENLVHKAIAISGSGIAPWAVAFEPLGYAKALAAKVSYTHKTNQKLAQHLAAANVDILVNAINEFEFTNNSVLFAPCVENVDLKGSFLEDAPINLIKAAKYRQIPYIAIYTSEEGTLRAAQAVHGKWLEKMELNFSDFLPVDLKFSNDTTKRNIGQYIRRHYFSDRAVDRETIHDYLDYQGDSLVTIPVIRGVKERAAAAKRLISNSTNAGGDSEGQIYIMKFDFKELPDKDWAFPEIPLDGTRHGGILKYIFDLNTANIDEKPKESLLHRFIAFANTGVPIAPINSGRGDVYWPPFARNMSYLIVTGKHGADFQDTSRRDPHSQDMEFWDEKVSQYYAAPERVVVNSPNKAMALNAGLILIVCQFLLKAF